MPRGETWRVHQYQFERKRKGNRIWTGGELGREDEA
jgi:hypothetical protein